MEDYKLDIMIDSGPNARSIQIDLKKFTLVGATTRKGLLTAPLRARFGIDLRLDFYDVELLQHIALRSAGILGIALTDKGAYEIARRSRGTPRIVNRLLRRTRDFAEVDGLDRIDEKIADKALNALEVDNNGLDDMDIRILTALIGNYKGGPVGVGTLAVAVGEEKGTIEEVYEPFLIQEGFLQRTPKGRVATAKAFSYLGIQPVADNRDLFT
jgi:Holliday junction DNA helicase RuvB